MQSLTKSLLALLFTTVVTPSVMARGNRFELPDVPDDFFIHYTTNNKGEISLRNPRAVLPEEIQVKSSGSRLRAFSTSKDTTAWSVSTDECSTNKSLKCVSIYNRSASYANGSQQSLTNKNRKDEGSFVLYQLDPKDSSKNAIYNCESKFVTGGVRDSSKLDDCNKYTASACEQWEILTSNESAFLKTMDSEVKQCEDLVAKTNNLRASMNRFFKSGIKDAEKELNFAFDKATSDGSLLRITSDVVVDKKTTPNATLQLATDFNKYNEKCRQYAGIFVSDREKTRRHLDSLIGQDPPSATKKLNDSLRKTKNQN